jgi:hypothetical protein
VSSRQLAQIAIAMQREIDKKTMPGAVVAIARKGNSSISRRSENWATTRARPCPRTPSFPLRP